jgi:hypothetical protein
MPKKIKSFNVDLEMYNSLAAMLKKYDSELSISYLVDKSLRELCAYFKTMEAAILDTDQKNDLMAFIIRRMGKTTALHTPAKDIPGQSEGLSSYNTKQIEPGVLPYIGQEKTEERKPSSVSISELDEEIAYWQDEWEGHHRNLSRAFVRHLKTGRFALSADKKYLIEKRNGKKYVDFIPNYIVEVASPPDDRKGPFESHRYALREYGSSIDRTP